MICESPKPSATRSYRSLRGTRADGKVGAGEATKRRRDLLSVERVRVLPDAPPSPSGDQGVSGESGAVAATE